MYYLNLKVLFIHIVFSFQNFLANSTPFRDSKLAEQAWNIFEPATNVMKGNANKNEVNGTSDNKEKNAEEVKEEEDTNGVDEEKMNGTSDNEAENGEEEKKENDTNGITKKKKKKQKGNKNAQTPPTKRKLEEVEVEKPKKKGKKNKH